MAIYDQARQADAEKKGKQGAVTADPELKAMERCRRLLLALDDDGRRRVLDFLLARFLNRRLVE